MRHTYTRNTKWPVEFNKLNKGDQFQWYNSKYYCDCPLVKGEYNSYHTTVAACTGHYYPILVNNELVLVIPL